MYLHFFYYLCTPKLYEYEKLVIHSISIGIVAPQLVSQPLCAKAYRVSAYSYTTLKGYPYSFRLSDNAYIDQHPADGEKYWIDIKYPTLNATIHCSYKPVRNNFRSLSHDAQEFLYKHTTVASAIPVQEFANPTQRVWGLYYELHGNTASPIQFILTDSIGHFFRGSVYCNCTPNQDSLAPIYDYLKKDVRVIIESMRWQ